MQQLYFLSFSQQPSVAFGMTSTAIFLFVFFSTAIFLFAFSQQLYFAFVHTTTASFFSSTVICWFH
jgi:hypothetical protein